MKKITVPKPTSAIVKSYLKTWRTLEKYVLQERSLNLLFRAYPKNTKIEHILIKVCCLNQFYSTHIFSPFAMAKHILALDIDGDLATGNDEVVNKIARVTMSKEKTYNLYSFASKYCSHHRSDHFPIYDRYVEKMLMQLERQEQFYKFRRLALHEYASFREILGYFKERFDLDKFSLKEIDRYLWLAGKEYFPKKHRSI
jgi:hypothetical protein